MPQTIGSAGAARCYSVRRSSRCMTCSTYRGIDFCTCVWCYTRLNLCVQLPAIYPWIHKPVCTAASDLPLDSQASPSAGGLFPWYIRRNQHAPCRVCCRHIFASHFRRSSAARSRRGGVDSAAAGDCTFTLLPRLGVCGLAQPHALRGAHPVYLRRPGSRRSPSATAVQLRAVRYVVGSPIWVVSSIRGLL